jgi:hypothetical protein
MLAFCLTCFGTTLCCCLIELLEDWQAGRFWVD